MPSVRSCSVPWLNYSRGGLWPRPTAVSPPAGSTSLGTLSAREDWGCRGADIPRLRDGHRLIGSPGDAQAFGAAVLGTRVPQRDRSVDGERRERLSATALAADG